MLVAIDPSQLGSVVGGQAVVEVDAPPGATVSVQGDNVQYRRLAGGKLLSSQLITAALGATPPGADDDDA